MRSCGIGQRAGLLPLLEDEPVPVELLPPLEPVLLEPMPLEPVLALLFGTMPAGHLSLSAALAMPLELELLLLVVPLALEVPAGTQSLADIELLGLAVLELLGLLVLPLELVCASAGSAMIRASAVVARSCFTPFLPG
jgi:hypothetical protein